MSDEQEKTQSEINRLQMELQAKGAKARDIQQLKALEKLCNEGVTDESGSFRGYASEYVKDQWEGGVNLKEKYIVCIHCDRAERRDRVEKPSKWCSKECFNNWIKEGGKKLGKDVMKGVTIGWLIDI